MSATINRLLEIVRPSGPARTDSKFVKGVFGACTQMPTILDASFPVKYGGVEDDHPGVGIRDVQPAIIIHGDARRGRQLALVVP